ncbi:ArsR/SmtB family transcription factor [Desulfocurvibacter africanus]|uniref:ArsR/SmtB family transcription factor n=1 Tax=Desulfocurvibacter africanus TaxID=873 RepID=UPI0009DB930C|nr:metalloregulator ArsR/SmtB family transcription factor [Desulfocurvibacter africanus]
MNCCSLHPACLAALSKHLQPELFKSLCDPSRLAVLTRLACAPGPLTVSEVASCCGAHISGASRHLKMLREAGLVQAEKRGREVVYRPCFNEFIKTLRGLADALEDCCASGECCVTENTEQQGDEHERT